MTSRARLLTALLIAGLTAILGWVSSGAENNSALEPAQNSWAPVSPTGAEDIDTFARRVIGLGLFPGAQLRVDENENAESMPDTIEGLAEAISSPDMSALVQRNDSWRLHIFGRADNQPEIKQVGDMLADGWIITDIAPTRVILRRGEEERHLEAFPAGETQNEE